MLSDLLASLNFSSRNAKLKELAGELNIPYTRKMSYRNLPRPVQRFKVFRGKSSRRIKNILSLQEEDIPGYFSLFDFHFTNSDEETRRTTILLFESDLWTCLHFGYVQKMF